MRLDRLDSHQQVTGNLGAAESLAHQAKHLQLAVGEPLEAGRWRVLASAHELLDETTGDLGREQVLASCDGSYAGDELLGGRVLICQLALAAWAGPSSAN